VTTDVKLTEAETAELFRTAALAKLASVNATIDRTPVWKLRTMAQLVSWRDRLVASIKALEAVQGGA
jgi:hypothetical protein